MNAALQACDSAPTVTLLEAGQVGGTSLSQGPAPVRTLARTARLTRDWSSWAQFGLTGPAPVPDLPAVLANARGWPTTRTRRRTWRTISAGTAST